MLDVTQHGNSHKTFIVERETSFDHEQFVHRSALEEDIQHLITESAVIVHNGEPIIGYYRLDDWDFGELKSQLKHLRYDKSERTGGLKTTSRVFGYQPRITLRRDFCSKTTLSAQQPNVHDLITMYAQRIQEIYASSFPERFAVHQKKVKEGDGEKSPIRSEWLIEGTVFTSGIINKNNPLKYHYDAGNLKDVNSCMLAFRDQVAGGYLACPEYGIGFEISDQTLLVFDGQSILHGVTPMRIMDENAYRFSMVFYTLLQMWRCEPLDRELARIRKIKTQRHRKRARA